MSSQVLHVGSRGGTISSRPGRPVDLFEVCVGSTCLLCESLHVGLAHLHRMERSLGAGSADPVAPGQDRTDEPTRLR